MSKRRSTPATKTGRVSAAALGILLCASAYATASAGADSADALSAFRHGPVAGSAPSLSASVDASVSDLLARLHYAFSDPRLPGERARQGEGEVLLRNSDAFVRATLPLTLGKAWLGFVYADMGAADSALRWQGLAGIHGGHGVDLLGGWRHVTYHFSLGRGFDSLDFNGPFLGATLVW